MNVKFFSSSVSIDQGVGILLAKADITTAQAKALIVELLGKLPEQEAAELIRTEFPDWLEA